MNGYVDGNWHRNLDIKQQKGKWNSGQEIFFMVFMGKYETEMSGEQGRE